MAQSLYITGTEPGSGKSIVALGVMETLAGRAQQAGFFRPIVPGDQPDPEIELMRGRYRLDSSYQEMHALTVDEANRLVASGAHDELEQQVFDAYKHATRAQSGRTPLRNWTSREP
jgi:phosphate acetyltransferase